MPTLKAFIALSCLLLAGCSSAYYGAMEKIGVAKREILVDRVGDARLSQQEAKEQFTDALQKFLAITQVKGGDLTDRYRELQVEFRNSESRADEVNRRISSVEDVAQALFEEWQDELGEYTDASLRKRSERQLEQTRHRYDELIGTMKKAAKRMDPILARFRDQILFLKHNLNARAIAGLSDTARGLEADISKLIADMEASIREADAFIRDMKASD